MSERTIKVGMIGAGFILKYHAAAVAAIPGLSLHVVADSSPARARQAAVQYGFEHSVTSLEEIAASDCEVVHVLLPSFLHEAAARTLIDAGKSVFLEKPMALSSGACSDLCERARERGVALGVNHNFLFTPRYEAIRAAIRAGELGRLDQLHVNWHAELAQLRVGPFDGWMVAAPANQLFETGAHLAGFVIDLLGPASVRSAVAGDPVHLPSGQIAYRHWSAIGEAGSAAVLLSLSSARGQPERYIRVRASAGSAQVDFGRDIAWRETTSSQNPTLDTFSVASQIARQTKRQARSDRRRRFLSTLRKRPDAGPYDESMYRSIRAFYAGDVKQVDSRHDGSFATEVMRLCEAISSAAGTGRATEGPLRVALPQSPLPPTVLVVGGTGFIGRRLVRLLAQRGIGVRVLTRNVAAAAIEFRDVEVELVQGSHGDKDVAARALEGVDTVYHLAKADGRRWSDYVEGDIVPTKVLAEAAVDAKVKRFIYTGTIDSYSSANPRDVIDSATPLDRQIAGRNLYARSKATSEEILQDLARRRDLPLVIVRPGIVIGPGSPASHIGVANFLNEGEVEFWGDGRNKLPLVLVDDVADALMRAYDTSGIEGETFLLTSDPLLSASDYVEELALHTGVRIRATRRASWKHWLPDLAKETLKALIRHPNRRKSTLHDWSCRAHRARYDSSYSRERLGWRPVADRAEMISRGIHAAATAEDH